jgi:hypothetical protein
MTKVGCCSQPTTGNTDQVKAFVPGDNGAWVVGLLSNELFGHVVASDVFGIAYVVPMADIFHDIQLRLSLDAVKLGAQGNLTH